MSVARAKGVARVRRGVKRRKKVRRVSTCRAKPASPTAIDTPVVELHVQIIAGYSIQLESTRLPILFLAIAAPLKLNDYIS